MASSSTQAWVNLMAKSSWANAPAAWHVTMDGVVKRSGDLRVVDGVCVDVIGNKRGGYYPTEFEAKWSVAPFAWANCGSRVSSVRIVDGKCVDSAGREPYGYWPTEALAKAPYAWYVEKGQAYQSHKYKLVNGALTPPLESCDWGNVYCTEARAKWQAAPRLWREGALSSVRIADGVPAWPDGTIAEGPWFTTREASLLTTLDGVKVSKAP